MRRMPSASVTVTTAGNPSGMAATASAIESSIACVRDSPRQSCIANSNPTNTPATIARRLPSSSSWRCSGLGPSSTLASCSESLPISVSMPMAVTSISPRPRVTIVFMYAMLSRSANAVSVSTKASISLPNGSDSPVSVDSLISRLTATISLPSAGMRSPASSNTMSPGTKCSAGISWVLPSRRTRALEGSIFLSAARLCSARYS